MRAQIASALFVLFAFFAALPFAAAQTSPIPAQPPQQTQEKFAPSAKPLPLPPATEIPLFPNQAGSANDPMITPQELKGWIGALQNQKDGLALSVRRFGVGPDAPPCAHIRIIQAPEMDSEMIIQTSPGEGGPIQTFQGLPPCRRDLPAPMTAQRFHGVPPMLPIPPRKRFLPSPVLQVPSAQTQPAQNEPDARSRKP